MQCESHHNCMSGSVRLQDGKKRSDLLRVLIPAGKAGARVPQSGHSGQVPQGQFLIGHLAQLTLLRARRPNSSRHSSTSVNRQQIPRTKGHSMFDLSSPRGFKSIHTFICSLSFGPHAYSYRWLFYFLSLPVPFHRILMQN